MSDTVLDRASASRPTPKPGILDIAPYVPGKSQVDGVEHPLKLSANENILGSSPAAREAFSTAFDQLQMYPDGRSTILRAALEATYGLEPDRLLFGCGSDEIFQLLNQTFLEPGDNIVQGEFGFGAYAIGARACQAEVRMAPEPGYRIDVDELLKLVDKRTRIVFVANPANPTGAWNSGEEIRRLHAGLPPSVVLCLDGAYAEFCDDPAYEDGMSMVREFENVVVTRTFSKLHGLAALRVGWAYMPPEMAAAVDRIRLPFNVNIPAQLAAVAALGDDDFQRRSLALVNQWRPWLAQQLGGLGLEPLPSAANFVLVGFPTTPGKTAKEADAFLSARGLIVRYVAGYGLPNHLRITIGLEAHNRAVVEALAEFMKGPAA
ncbi:histidinol-phosphate aminotransferase [Phenylobacterium sp. Root77]|uniref:histidinol-phosphate transaminase n=1 Tax=unclassified Phenylobacterium TaxID=2640670 RepID=UPI0007000B2A|nr:MULTISPECIES: histidinol-phosphate transaminase [unclassified Phenylobacterium]KQW70727.1 histidinol-phosphate aminotransferase [Phenylobacterium sp. Root1277]KQW90852.1 histidinol-phosphate aminotransferase [Phenylobacterium sp. Root1290]KRC39516.1 histidinol-phosphate aminotransferase [Phenylobacterium sp. Root77]